ncbi:hypothetical protein PG993_010374 [Apiospora rasikravindrae]|uniref:DUF6594 domain-containing protein n=1 Tax=Apiospora rasikravindrae TaxID=990691 RepID=A0ABR1SM45_9PEZI
MSILPRNEVLEKPWKYIGYPAFARYLSLDDDFFVIRRYDRLHCRVLITLQDEIAMLEEELDVLDARYSDRNAADVDNGSVRRDQPERKALVKRISVELMNYDELLYRYTQMKSRPIAPKENLGNIRNWLANNNKPIEGKELEFLKARDLITLAKGSKSLLRRLFERYILSSTSELFGFLASRRHRDGDSTVHGQDEPIDTVIAPAIFVTAAVMLISPLWILAVTQSMFARLGIITGFNILLLAVLTSATLAKPFEILAVAAGYSAVLVVFLQIGSIS